MPFLSLKTGSAEQELCPLFGSKDAPEALCLNTGALAGYFEARFGMRNPPALHFT